MKQQETFIDRTISNQADCVLPGGGGAIHKIDHGPRRASVDTRRTGVASAARGKQRLLLILVWVVGCPGDTSGRVIRPTQQGGITLCQRGTPKRELCDVVAGQIY